MNRIEASFLLLRSAIEGDTPPLSELTAARWWSLFRTMQQNHVAALCYDAATRGGMPREVQLPWLAERQKAEEWYAYQKEVQQEVVRTMQQHGVPTMTLKGTSIAAYYPREQWREFGDIDLFFYNKHRQADRVAEKELGVGITNDSHHHTKYDYRGVTIESHYHLLITSYPPSNRAYERLLRRHIGTPTFEVLFLLRHAAGHFASARITLRDICDWVFVCRALQDQVDWQVVADAAKSYGMIDFVAQLCAIAHRRLGVDTPFDVKEVDDTERMERDIVMGSIASQEQGDDGIRRLGWKVRRWHTMRWKRRMVYRESDLTLLLSSIASHIAKPRSILHKL